VAVRHRVAVSRSATVRCRRERRRGAGHLFGLTRSVGWVGTGSCTVGTSDSNQCPGRCLDHLPGPPRLTFVSQTVRTGPDWRPCPATTTDVRGASETSWRPPHPLAASGARTIALRQDDTLPHGPKPAGWRARRSVAPRLTPIFHRRRRQPTREGDGHAPGRCSSQQKTAAFQRRPDKWILSRRIQGAARGLRPASSPPDSLTHP
jgi:hypothetical protein